MENLRCDLVVCQIKPYRNYSIEYTILDFFFQFSTFYKKRCAIFYIIGLGKMHIFKIILHAAIFSL